MSGLAKRVCGCARVSPAGASIENVSAEVNIDTNSSSSDLARLIAPVIPTNLAFLPDIPDQLMSNLGTEFRATHALGPGPANVQ